MSAFWSAYWPVFLIAVAIGLVAGIFIFRPRQHVTLSRDTAPVRPHMTAAARGTDPGFEPNKLGEGNGIGDEAAAAASDLVGEFIGAPVHSRLPGSAGIPDDLQRMKGVGPRLAGLLQQRGIFRFEQLAAMEPDEIGQLDDSLGTFKGRLARDRVADQARLLARGDQAGYEAEFGKL